MKEINTIANSLKFNIKTIFFNRSFMIILFLTIFSVQLSMIILFPLYVSNLISSWVVVYLSTALIYGMITLEWRESTAYKNSRLTSNNSITNYLSSFITCIIFSVIFSYLFFAIWIIITHLFPAVGVWSWDSSSSGDVYVSLKRFDYLAQIYYILVTTTITYLISFIVGRLIPDKKGFYIFVFTFVLWTLFFGDLISCSTLNHFTRPGSNNVMVDSSFYNAGSQQRTLFTNDFFRDINTINPFYGINAFFYPVVDMSSYSVDPITGASHWLRDIPKVDFLGISEDWTWNFMEFSPLFWIGGLVITSLLIVKFGNK